MGFRRLTGLNSAGGPAGESHGGSVSLTQSPDRALPGLQDLSLCARKSFSWLGELPTLWNRTHITASPPKPSLQKHPEKYWPQPWALRLSQLSIKWVIRVIMVVSTTLGTTARRLGWDAAGRLPRAASWGCTSQPLKTKANVFFL